MAPLPPTPLRASVPVRALLALPRLSPPALVSASPLDVAFLLDSVVLLLVSVAPLLPWVVSLPAVSRRPQDLVVVEDPPVDLVSDI